MKKSLAVFSMLVLLISGEAKARILVPDDDAYIAEQPAEPYSDTNNNGQHDDGEPYTDVNNNGEYDGGYSINPTGMTYSATWDSAFNPLNINPLSIPVCIYNRLPELESPPQPAQLIVNKFFLLDNNKVLFGVSNPKACPLPGSQILREYAGNYASGIVGDFLISGAVCVVNTVLFDAMFRVYCTIVLWFYPIIYAMIIIYIMLYGLAIMLGIGQDPMREAPKRIIKILIIFLLATNAQYGFRYVHQFFLSTMNYFSDILTDSQPIFTETGQPAYDKVTDVASILGLDTLKLGSEGTLLDLNGNHWRPLPKGTAYFDVADPSLGAAISKVPDSYTPLSADEIDKYIPFRIPAMQWTYAESPKGSGNYKMLPVFQEAIKNTVITPGYFSDPANEGKFLCIFDVIWNPNAIDTNTGKPVKQTLPGGREVIGRLEEFPRCQKNFWLTLPNISPYGQFVTLATDDSGNIVSFPDSNIYGADATTVPPRLIKPSYIYSNNNPDSDTYEPSDYTLDETSLDTVCDRNADPLGWGCRKPFQGVLSRVDAMFSSVLGDDNAKSIGALAGALVLWGVFGGAFLAIFLMTGVLTMFLAFIQTLWVYVTAIMAVSFLLMLSPIFIGCALFKVTERFFQGWLGALISYSMQPFLVMVFIYILSSMVNLDRLTELVKNEVAMKLYHVDESGTKGGTYFWAKSFKEPLYEKPIDFDERFNPNAVMNKSEVSNVKPQILIDGSQRINYLEKRGEFLLANWIAKQVGLSNTATLHLQSDADKLKNYSEYVNIQNLWYSGVYPSNSPTTWASWQSKEKGIDAVIEFKNNTGDTRFDDLIQYYKDNLIPSDQEDYTTTAGDVDDGDSYVGEGEGSVDKNGTARKAEFPTCKKYCPEFNPPYIFDNKDYSNPNITAPYYLYYGARTLCKPDDTGCKKYNIDYTNTVDCTSGDDCYLQLPKLCPDTNSDGKPDPCEPNAYCTKYCMKLPGAIDSNFKFLFAAILVWIMLNTITAAFMTKVPEIAAALSNWQDYAPKDNSQVLRLGGTSRSWKYSDDENTSSFHHLGALLNLDPDRPGTVPAGIMKMMKTISGDRYQFNESTGKLVERKITMAEIYRGGFFTKPDEDPLTRIQKVVQEKLFNDPNLDKVKQGQVSLDDQATIYLTEDVGGKSSIAVNRNDINQAVRSIMGNNAKFSYMSSETMINEINKYFTKIEKENLAKNSPPGSATH